MATFVTSYPPANLWRAIVNVHSQMATLQLIKGYSATSLRSTNKDVILSAVSTPTAFVSFWNKLPAEIAHASLVNIFKLHLDASWRSLLPQNTHTTTYPPRTFNPT